MEFKERKRIKREELEGFLKSAAEEVKKKTKSEFFDIEVEYEEKRKHGSERAKFEIEIKWEKSEGAEQKRSGIISSTEIKSGAKIDKPEMSRTKQEMKVIQKGLLPLVDAGIMPEIEKIDKLIELNSIFAEYSKGKEWENEHILFTPKLSELRDAVKEKNLEKTKNLAYEISALKKACHQKHIKDKE